MHRVTALAGVEARIPHLTSPPCAEEEYLVGVGPEGLHARVLSGSQEQVGASSFGASRGMFSHVATV